MQINVNTDIVIKPIFDQQQPMIWENFVDIEAAARSKYGHMFLYGAFNSIYDSYYHSYKSHDINMAFAAYYNGEMVGFTEAYMLFQHELYLNALFVNPEFHGNNIGAKLLKTVEQSAALLCSNVQGICYPWSNGFYKKMGYSVSGNKDDNQIFVKRISLDGRGAVLPVFHKWKISDFKVKSNVRGVDSTLLRKSFHQPVCVFVNNQQQIDVVGFVDENGENIIWANDNLPKDIRSCRENAVKGYLNRIR